jgi:N-acetylglucosaminyldiphosphoundecaprenol N-acetyl-beta-D-mannosaminyltransferase
VRPLEPPASTPAVTAEKQKVAGLYFNSLSEDEVIQHIISEVRAGNGGWVATPNIDICHQVRNDSSLLKLLESASLTVPDGMPLIWAAKIMGTPLAARVTGSSLIFTLTKAAAAAGLSVYLLGGEPGVPEAAGENLERCNPGLKFAGADSPVLGFDKSPDEVSAVCGRVRAAAPDIVFVGFPKQERLITQLAEELPHAWFVGCGAAIKFAAGTADRAPAWMQRSGMEWAHRLMKEPKRLFRRYLVDDLPFALTLLATAAVQRARTKDGGEGAVPGI